MRTKQKLEDVPFDIRTSNTVDADIYAEALAYMTGVFHIAYILGSSNTPLAKISTRALTGATDPNFQGIEYYSPASVRGSRSPFAPEAVILVEDALRDPETGTLFPVTCALNHNVRQEPGLPANSNMNHYAAIPTNKHKAVKLQGHNISALLKPPTALVK